MPEINIRGELVDNDYTSPVAVNAGGCRSRSDPVIGET